MKSVCKRFLFVGLAAICCISSAHSQGGMMNGQVADEGHQFWVRPSPPLTIKLNTDMGLVDAFSVAEVLASSDDSLISRHSVVFMSGLGGTRIEQSALDFFMKRFDGAKEHSDKYTTALHVYRLAPHSKEMSRILVELHRLEPQEEDFKKKVQILQKLVDTKRLKPKRVKADYSIRLDMELPPKEAFTVIKVLCDSKDEDVRTCAIMGTYRLAETTLAKVALAFLKERFKAERSEMVKLEVIRALFGYYGAVGASKEMLKEMRESKDPVVRKIAARFEKMMAAEAGK